jgi:hypothetical protein
VAKVLFHQSADLDRPKDTGLGVQNKPDRAKDLALSATTGIRHSIGRGSGSDRANRFDQMRNLNGGSRVRKNSV